MELKGAVALIAGGASGLGAAAARRFVESGAKVLILDMDADRGAALAAELGDSTRFAQADVTDEEAVKAAVDKAVSAFGALHVNVNCAGIAVALRTLSK
ncbi:MAG: 3-hydroxyacyl-CoA dehydrogenase, partial [Phototrophicales bacterium]